MGSSLMFLESAGVDFGGPWELLGRTLEVLGLILECLGHPKLTQSDPGWNLADFEETYENIMVLTFSWNFWNLNLFVVKFENFDKIKVWLGKQKCV